MIRDITLGQYYPADSKIHHLDPRTKIIGTFLYILSLFIIEYFPVYSIIFVFLGAAIWLSKIPLSYMLKGLKAIYIIIILTVLLNLFLTPGEPIFQWEIITITQEGVTLAVFMALRLILLIIGSSLLTFTTSPIELTDGIEYLLSPLKKIKVPAHEIAMMMTIALRFIPILLEETDKIMKAQMARGAEFDTGGLVKKAKSLIPLLVPLFISAFRRADELAMAMEARCYRGDVNRTRMKQLLYQPVDYIAWSILLSYLVILIVLRIVI